MIIIYLIHTHSIHHLVQKRAATTKHSHHHHDKRQKNQEPRNVGVSLLAQIGQNVCPEDDKHEFQRHSHNRNVIQKSNDSSQSRKHKVNLCGGAHFVKFIHVLLHHFIYYFLSIFYSFQKLMLLTKIKK